MVYVVGSEMKTNAAASFGANEDETTYPGEPVCEYNSIAWPTEPTFPSDNGRNVD